MTSDCRTCLRPEQQPYLAIISLYTWHVQCTCWSRPLINSIYLVVSCICWCCYTEEHKHKNITKVWHCAVCCKVYWKTLCVDISLSNLCSGKYQWYHKLVCAFNKSGKTFCVHAMWRHMTVNMYQQYAAAEKFLAEYIYLFNFLLGRWEEMRDYFCMLKTDTCCYVDQRT